MDIVCIKDNKYGNIVYVNIQTDISIHLLLDNYSLVFNENVFNPVMEEKDDSKLNHVY